jgi:hypothetical protein
MPIHLDQRHKAAQKIVELEDESYKGHTLEGSLKGGCSLEFSLPGVAYRAAYIVLEGERVCLVFIVCPHENFYEKAERRYHGLRKA